MSASNAVARIEPRHLAEIPGGRVAAVPAEQLSLWDRLFFQGITDWDRDFCVGFCQYRDLDPLRGEIVFIKFEKKLNNRPTGEYTITPVVTAVGYRLQAERSGLYAGQTPRQWCGPDGVWKDIWLDTKNPPVAARVGVLKHGFVEPLYATALYHRFVKTYQGQPTGLWKTFPEVMLATRAETAAFKLAFPETRQNTSRDRAVSIREVGGQVIRTLDGAVVDNGGDRFEHLAIAETIAEREVWVEANRLLHAAIKERFPDSDAHQRVHDLVEERLGLESTKDASIDQLIELRVELEREAYGPSDVIDVDGQSVDASSGEILDRAAPAQSKQPAKKPTAPGPGSHSESNLPGNDPNGPSLEAQQRAIRNLGLPKVGSDDLTLLCGDIRSLTHAQARDWITYLQTATKEQIRAEIAKRYPDGPVEDAADDSEDDPEATEQASLLDQELIRRADLADALTK